MSDFSRWIFDFETPKDWEPATPWCWINCPISILAPLGKPCPGMKPNLDVCPIRKRAERIKSLAEMYESENKMVPHPDHYQSKSGLEVITVIKAFTEGLEGIQAVDTANIIKYACRWNKKANSIEDKIENVEKIIWYATDLKEELEKLKGEETNEN